MFFRILLLPLLAGFAAQTLKFFIRSNGQKDFFKTLTAYSGMPSGHSAIVVSLSTIVGLEEGFKSPLFAITVILAIIIIRDALGIRRYLGEHGKILNILVKDLADDKMLDNQYPQLLEKIGHTPLQVFIGGLIGLLTSLIGYILLD